MNGFCNCFVNILLEFNTFINANYIDNIMWHLVLHCNIASPFILTNTNDIYIYTLLVVVISPIHTYIISVQSRSSNNNFLLARFHKASLLLFAAKVSIDLIADHVHMSSWGLRQLWWVSNTMTSPSYFHSIHIILVQYIQQIFRKNSLITKNVKLTLLTHWSLRDVEVISLMYFPNSFYEFISQAHPVTSVFGKYEITTLMIDNVGSDNGMVPWDNSLPDPMLTQICVAIWRQKATLR